MPISSGVNYLQVLAGIAGGIFLVFCLFFIIRRKYKAAIAFLALTVTAGVIFGVAQFGTKPDEGSYTSTSEAPTLAPTPTPKPTPAPTLAPTPTPKPTPAPTPASGFSRTEFESLNDLGDHINKGIPATPSIDYQRGEFETEKAYKERMAKSKNEEKTILVAYWRKIAENSYIWWVKNIDLPKYDMIEHQYVVVKRWPQGTIWWDWKVIGPPGIDGGGFSMFASGVHDSGFIYFYIQVPVEKAQYIRNAANAGQLSIRVFSQIEQPIKRILDPDLSIYYNPWHQAILNITKAELVSNSGDVLHKWGKD